MAASTALLQAALNGDRVHPAAPRTPRDIAAQAVAAVAAGARSLHLHPYDPDGNQTFDAGACAQTLRQVRAACPGISISLSTSADGRQADGNGDLVAAAAAMLQRDDAR